MTIKVTIPADGEFHLAYTGACRIQIMSNNPIGAFYGLTPTSASAYHVERGNIAYPADDGIYLKVLGDTPVDVIVTGVEV